MNRTRIAVLGALLLTGLVVAAEQPDSATRIIRTA
jgi:hypothetical protein